MCRASVTEVTWPRHYIGFDFILEQILNLHSQRKTSETRSMKSLLGPKDKKKNPRDLCSYYSKPSHIEEKYYYKHSEHASQNFQERFKDRIRKLQSIAHVTKSYINIEVNVDDISEQHLSENQGLIARNKGRILVTGDYDKSWYFDNTVSYYITCNLANFQKTALSKCQHPYDDITLADGSTVIPDGTGTAPFLFYVNEHTEKILLSGVCYCSKLDTKLIFLGILNK